MLFQLEPHEVPEKYRNEDFYVQVALRVNSVETALVPNNLETAHTASETTIIPSFTYFVATTHTLRNVLYSSYMLDDGMQEFL